MLTLTLDTRPEALEIDLARTAVVVVDMQNAFASRGGMLDLAGVDISGADRVVRRIAELLEAARAASVQVVYLHVLEIDAVSAISAHAAIFVVNCFSVCFHIYFVSSIVLNIW